MEAGRVWVLGRGWNVRLLYPVEPGCDTCISSLGALIWLLCLRKSHIMEWKFGISEKEKT